MTVAVVLGWLLIFVPRVSRRTSRPDDYDEAATFEAVAAELKRGASLRHAVAAVYPGTHLSRLAISGQPMSWVAAEMLERSPRRDGLVGAGLQLAAATGASAQELFVALAERVRAERRMAARKRVLTAQARASALVVALLPIVLGLVLILTRNSDAITGSTSARAAVLLGLAMQVAGAALVLVLSRQVSR